MNCLLNWLLMAVDGMLGEFIRIFFIVLSPECFGYSVLGS